MKRKLFLAVCAVALLTIFSGCASKPEKKDFGQVGDLADAPSWVLNPEVEGVLAAVGSSKMSKAGIQFTRTNALANGRDELARQMSLKVKNLVKNFTQATGIGDDETVDKVSSSVSKQVAKQTLTGSKQKSMWISPGNELFVLVVLDAKSVAQAVKEQVQTSYKNEKALWQQFQAKKAQEELDAEIEKEFGDF